MGDKTMKSLFRNKNKGVYSLIKNLMEGKQIVYISVLDKYDKQTSLLMQYIKSHGKLYTTRKKIKKQYDILMTIRSVICIEGNIYELSLNTMVSYNMVIIIQRN